MTELVLEEVRGLDEVLEIGAGTGLLTVPLARAVRRLVATDAAVAGLVIPSDRDAAIELVIDLAAPLQVRAPLEGALTAVVLRALVPATLRLESRSPPGRRPPIAQASAFQIAVPANAVLFGFFLALTVATSLASDRRTGAWRRLLAAPVSRGTALIASLVPYLLIGLVQLAFLFGVRVLVFGMEIAGSVSALVAVSIALVYCAVSLGLLFAAIGGSERQLGAFGSVVLLVMGILGGCMVPRLLMPPEMQTVGLAIPHAWALDGYYDVLVRAGTGVAEVAPAVGALVGFGTLFAMFGVAWFRFEE